MMRLAQSGKLATALDELLQNLTQPDDIDETTLLKARLSNLEANKAQTDSRDYRVEWNTIACNIINLAKKLVP